MENEQKKKRTQQNTTKSQKNPVSSDENNAPTSCNGNTVSVSDSDNVVIDSTDSLDSNFESIKKKLRNIPKAILFSVGSSVCLWLILKVLGGFHIEWIPWILMTVSLLILSIFLMKWNRVLKDSEENKQNRTNMKNCQRNILETWKKRWPEIMQTTKTTEINTDGTRGIHEKTETIKKYQYFYRTFLVSYEYISKKVDSNRRSNFFWKGTFILTLTTALLLFLIFLVINQDQSWQILLVNDGVFLLVLMLGAGIVAKWLDIKKYQETWGRHSRHLHYLNLEILYYLDDITPYSDALNKELLFVQRVCDLWNKNQQKFTDNMESKEKDLMDVVTRLKS